MSEPSLLVTVDTEGDHEWEYARHPRHENLSCLEEFDRRMVKLGIPATYLVTYTVAKDPRSVAVLGDLLGRGHCEIGAHCHSWNNPPVEEPPGAQVFLNELPENLQFRKLEILTETLEFAFGERPTSFRGGRFGANAATLRSLEALGYRVDSSVTPGVSWRATPGIPKGPGGPDFRDALHEPYVPSLEDICRPGDSALLEIPVTMWRTREIPRGLERAISWFGPTGLVARATKRLGMGRVLWYRPSFQSLEETVAAADLGRARGSSVYNMLLHSSELMPGGSPYARTREDVNALLDRTERSLEHVLRTVNAVPRTLEQCRRAWEAERPGAPETEAAPSVPVRAPAGS